MSDYKRLTHKNGNRIEEYCEVGHCKYADFRVCKLKGIEHNVDEDCIPAMIERLAELEDKIEQGYIQILPVKAGYKIYVVPSKVNFDLNKLNGYSERNRVYEQTVDEIRFFRKDIYMVFSCDYLENHRGASLGETWFLTREEAEKRLKELQNG